MAEAEKPALRRLKRLEKEFSLCDFEGLLEYLDAIAEETLDEKKKQEKAQAANEFFH
ncbi:MAG: hypothetical protein ACE5I5_08680 [Candidatus Heimdallarchaeota archaeon]